MENPPRGLFFEDFEIGREFRTSARTVTQTDIINFACLSGDFNEVHANWGNTAKPRHSESRSRTGP